LREEKETYWKIIKKRKLLDDYILATKKKKDLYVNKFPFSIRVQLRWFLPLNMTRK
jgi:hypothetical protein